MWSSFLAITIFFLYYIPGNSLSFFFIDLELAYIFCDAIVYVETLIIIITIESIEDNKRRRRGIYIYIEGEVDVGRFQGLLNRPS